MKSALQIPRATVVKISRAYSYSCPVNTYRGNPRYDAVSHEWERNSNYPANAGPWTKKCKYILRSRSSPGRYRDRITVARFDLNSSRVRTRPRINFASRVYLPVDTQSSGGGGGVGVVEGDGTLLAAALIIGVAGLYRGTCNTTQVFTDRSTGSSCTGGPAACNRRGKKRVLVSEPQLYARRQERFFY